MTKRWLRFLLGLNGASIVRGMRLGFSEFLGSCYDSFAAVHPCQGRMAAKLQKQLKAIPEISLDEILGSRKAAVRLSVQCYEDGMMPYHEILALLAILVVENPKEVLEIGTYMGHTSRAMAENLGDAIIHTVDLPPDFSGQQNSKDGPPKDDFHLIQRRVVGREFKGTKIADRIKQHFGDTAVLDFQAIGKPTFFYIDGSHTYEYCKQDSEKCIELSNGSGTFLWHDCDAGHPGVLRFILEWRSLGRNIARIKGTSIAYWKSIPQHRFDHVLSQQPENPAKSFW